MTSEAGGLLSVPDSPARSVAAFDVRSERVLTWALLAVAFGVVPLVASEYWFNAVLTPFLVLALAGLGLNLLTGCTGQLSLGSAAFMAVGAFAAYNFTLRVPGLPLLASFALGGLTAAAFGILFGLPSLRIKGFYLIVSTLAAQFFVPWVLTRFGWFSNYNPSGVISAPKLEILGQSFDSPSGRYLLALGIVTALTWFALNLVRSSTGRNWMAVRDMDTAAAVIGVPLFQAKLLAFAVSSFYCGIAGVLWAFAYVGTVEPHGLDLNRSFQVLFIVIIGGLGSVLGSFLGAAFMVLFPILLANTTSTLLPGLVDASNQQNLEKIIFGSLIVLVLIKEPEGLARVWRRVRDSIGLRPAVP